MASRCAGVGGLRTGIESRVPPARSATSSPGISVDIGAGDHRGHVVPPDRVGTSGPLGGVADPAFLPVVAGPAFAAQVVRSDRGTCVVRVIGAVDAHKLMQLQHRCHAELELGTTALVLDFTGMTGCPSALFMGLSRIMAEFRLHACSVELVGLLEALTAIVMPARPEGSSPAPDASGAGPAARREYPGLARGARAE